jgi:hypothetical protein
MLVASIAYAISSTVPFAFYGIAMPVMAAMIAGQELDVFRAIM